MTRFPLRTLIVLLLLSFVAGFITCFLIFEDYGFLNPRTSKEVTIKSITKEANDSDASFEKQIEKLTSQNIELQQQMDLSQSLLEDAKKIAQQKEDRIQYLIKQKNSSSTKLLQKSFKAKPQTYLSNAQTELLENAEVELLPDKDNNYCDSLAQEVTSYIEDNKRKDSIYELQLIQFDRLLSGKDSIIQASSKVYGELRLSFDKTVSMGATLQKENLALKKENKRQRFKSKLFAGGLMILSGFATQIFLH
jgi:aspartyl-tRNA synthetase